jgi:hypothetical protein
MCLDDIRFQKVYWNNKKSEPIFVNQIPNNGILSNELKEADLGNCFSENFLKKSTFRRHFVTHPPTIF